MIKERYELSIDPIDIPEDVIDLFKVDGKWKTNNHKACLLYTSPSPRD